MAIYYVVEGREFIPGESKKAKTYAQQLANERGQPVTINIEHAHITRDPSGFVYDSEVYKRAKKVVKPKKVSNPQKGKWIPAHAVRFNKDGSVSIMK